MTTRTRPARGQTYCPCGEPKKDRARHCTVCTDERIAASRRPDLAPMKARDRAKSRRTRQPGGSQP